MFARRHPFLFFLLSFSAITASALVVVTLSVVWTVRGIAGGDFGVSEGKDRVGVIEILGPIVESRRALEDLKRFREDETIRAIVIRIDSPGGAVGPSQEIYREVRKTVPAKPVAVSMGTVAASGGYYVAAGAPLIVANPGTITGSIGVIMGFANYRELLEKIGLVPIVVKSGEYKDVGSPVRPMEEEERAFLEAFVKKIHRQFIEDVAEGRKMEVARVEKLADGRIFTGSESKELGLVDRLGNLTDTVEWAGRMAGIEGRIATVYARERRLSLLEWLRSEASLLMRELTARLEPGPQPEFRYRP